MFTQEKCWKKNIDSLRQLDFKILCFCRRESMRQTIGTENKENQKKGKSCSCGRSNKKKKKRNMYKEGDYQDLFYKKLPLSIR